MVFGPGGEVLVDAWWKKGLNALTGIDGFWTLSRRDSENRYYQVLTPLRALMVFGLTVSPQEIIDVEVMS